MPKENTKQRIFTRRSVIFGGLQLVGFAALVTRLGYLQFIKADEYATLSENNRIKLRVIIPERGVILDRRGVAMATNEKNYRLFLDPSGQTGDALKATWAQLQTLLPLPDKKWKPFSRGRAAFSALPEMLKEHLSWEEVSLIELNRPNLPGVYVDVGQIRHYPLVEAAAHLIGYLGVPTLEEIEGEDDGTLARQPDFRIGKVGVERMLETDLRGVAGIRQVEVNVHGVPVREVGKRESVAGQNLRLTIDSRLQQFAAATLAGESASAVVMDVTTGHILALVSMPAFDPGVFSMGISTDDWSHLSNHPKHPLLNKAISGQYPPGSTFKMIVGLAGLEAGIITPDSTVFCPGHYMLGDHQFNCWKEGGHGTVNYHEAIAQSCDTFFYELAEKLGVQRYADMARRFGLGESLDMGLVNEKSGVVADPQWKQDRYRQRWTMGDTINGSIGQGYMLATPLQLAVMMARLASGKVVKPSLATVASLSPPSFDSLPVRAGFLEITRDAMDAVVNSPTGTAYGRRIMEPSFAYGGKTGTSQVRKLVQRGLDQDTLPWEQRHHALFVGFAPVVEPRYAVSVVVEHGGGGAAAAAPIARELLLKAQQLEI